jgi:hypothetical protein
MKPGDQTGMKKKNGKNLVCCNFDENYIEFQMRTC